MARMKLKFETCFRGLVIILVITATCSLWAAAQTKTNTTAEVEIHTNQPRPVTNHLEELGQRYLTFGLDRLPALREIRLLREPLWKYLASLIYIFLAFYIAKLFDLVAERGQRGQAVGRGSVPLALCLLVFVRALLRQSYHIPPTVSAATAMQRPAERCVS